MPRRPTTPALALLAGAALLVGAAPVSAASAEVCVDRAAVYDTPGGFVVGFVVDGQRVKVLKRSASRKHYRVRSPQRVTGWVRSSAFC